MITLLIVTFLSIFLYTRYQDRQKKRNLLIDLKENFYIVADLQEVQWEDVSLLHKELMPTEEILDDVTWNDLDMNQLYQRLNQTQSFLGEQVLYHQLRSEPLTPSQAELMEQQIKVILQQEEKRVEIQSLLIRLGKKSKDYSLVLYFNHPHTLSNKLNHIVKVLQVLLISSFIFFVLSQQVVFLLLLLFVGGTNLILYLAYKTKLEIALHSLAQVKQCISICQSLLKVSDYWDDQSKVKLSESINKIKSLTKLIGNLQSLNSSQWTTELFGLARDFSVGVTLWDFTTYAKINKLLITYQKEVWDCVQAIGHADMIIAIAAFRKSCPVFCTPIFTDNKQMTITNLVHPLLKHPVSNDFVLDKPCLITGSNASGKSTFIKAVAISAILAQQVNTCSANSFTMPRMNIVSSMTIRDDLLGQDSYYVKELKYLKRILEQVKPQQVSLCVMDEILRGTNAEERLVISKAFLSTLAEKNCLMIVATHDTTLIEQFKSEFQCSYFMNEVENETLIFDYKIHLGVSPQTNAIQLLRQLEFPESLIAKAQQEAKRIA